MEDWIDKIKKDENNVLKELYILYKSDCIIWLYHNYSLGEEDAKEVFQNAIIILYDNVMTGKLTTLSSSIKSYIYAIAKNKAREQKRHLSRYVTDEYLKHNATEEDLLADKNEIEGKIEHINLSMEKLGDPCKSLLQLFYYKKMDMTDIANLMGYKNADTAKNQKYKCMKRLQSIVLAIYN